MQFGKTKDARARHRRLRLGMWAGAFLALLPPAVFAEAVPPLLGTVVSESKDSYALFGAGDGFAWVKEGEAVAPDLELVHVAGDHVTVKRQSTGQQIQIDIGNGGSFDGSAPASQSPPRTEPTPRATRPTYRPSDLRAMTPQQLERLNEEIRAEFERARAEDSSQETTEQDAGREREDVPGDE